MRVAEYLRNIVPDQTTLNRLGVSWRIENWKSGGKTVPLHAMKTY